MRVLLNLVFILCCGITSCLAEEKNQFVDFCKHTYVNKSMDMLILNGPTAFQKMEQMSCNCTVETIKGVHLKVIVSRQNFSEFKHCNTGLNLTTDTPLICNSTSHTIYQKAFRFDLLITSEITWTSKQPIFEVRVKPEIQTHILANCSTGIEKPLTPSATPKTTLKKSRTTKTSFKSTTSPKKSVIAGLEDDGPNQNVSNCFICITGHVYNRTSSTTSTSQHTSFAESSKGASTNPSTTNTSSTNYTTPSSNDTDLTTKPPTTTTTKTTPTTTTSVATETETTGDRGTSTNQKTTNTPSTNSTTSSSNDTVVIVGAVVGMGIPMLVLISCLYCYIARLHKSKDSDQQLSTQPPSRPPHRQNFLQRTFTLARDRIIPPRPLPRIPSAVNKLSLRRKVIEREVNSGVYDSIRSSLSDVQFNCHNNNNNRITHNYDNVIISKMNKLSSIKNASQQLSFNSSSSYVYPTDVIMHSDRNDATKPKVVSTVSDLVETDERYMPMLLVNRNDVAAVSQNDDVHIEPQSAKSSDQYVKTLVNDIKQASANYDSFNIYPNNFRIPSDSSYVNLSGINAKPIVADKVQKPKPASKPKPAPKPKPNPKPKYETVEKSECDAEALHSNDKQTSDYDNLFFYKRS